MVRVSNLDSADLRSGSRTFNFAGRPMIRVPGASPPVAGERYLEAFQICARCRMIEQESDGADNSTRVPTARQACYETAAAISAMLVWALPGRPLALPLRHRVRAVPVPALGAAALVAAAGLPAGLQGLMAGHTRTRA